MSALSSGSKNNRWKVEPDETPKMEARCSAETLTFIGPHDIMFEEIELLIPIATSVIHFSFSFIAY
jgi:hypothetical protein